MGVEGACFARSFVFPQVWTELSYMYRDSLECSLVYFLISYFDSFIFKK